MAQYIRRSLEPLVRRYADNFKVVVVVGPRQVGKTTMLRHLMEEDASRGVPRSYVTLDNTAILQTARQDPALFLQRWHPPVLIDEIQKAPELLPCIKEVVDTSSQLGSVWLTGSQPLHLLREGAESLAGRVGIIEMLGLSNAEMEGLPSEPSDPSPDYFTRRAALCTPLDVTEVLRADLCGITAGHTRVARGPEVSWIRIISRYACHAGYTRPRSSGRRA